MSAAEISAEVIPRLEGGRQISTNEIVTSENLAGYRIDRKACENATRFFRQSGFTVAPVVGISFSISGPATLFERVFGGKLTVEESSGVVQSVATVDGDAELSLDRLPGQLSSDIQAVTFMAVDLHDGPTSFGA